MTTSEAKLAIATEFISRYLEWLADANNAELSNTDYGKKYGYYKIEGGIKDNQRALIWFQSHIFSGRFRPGWEKAGYTYKTIVELHHAGFFSYDYNSSWQARQLGKTDFYYINQAKAKEIYKAYKKGYFNAE